ncbi:unnamed protein product [Macrosiphum euphorbiae]|uniref:Transposase domain-containing protein n=1 Tax=Macrosiphum euphorbiae TaxID=13131 RepID=A0AAV0Y9G5_9HEMI|nr:unnamed protein product [Macrosiphum euphorbiae]
MSEKRKTNQQDLSANVSQRTLRRRIATELENMLNISDQDLVSNCDIYCTLQSDASVMNKVIQGSNNNQNKNISTVDNLYMNESISNSNEFNTFDLKQSSQSSSTENDEYDRNILNENANININTSNKDQDFVEKLKHWAVEYKIKQNALDALLGILRKETIGENLPKVSRTFLKTPRNTLIQIVSPDQYCHFGLKIGLEKVLNRLQNDDLLNSLNFKISLKISTDGLPLSESSTSQLWPILGCIIQTSHVFVIGIYHGLSKPNDANTFLQYFVDEMTDLTNNGIYFNNIYYKVNIHCIICDAPAKSFITKTKGHTGYNSCSKCCQEGEFLYNRICFPEVRNNILKTDDGFSKQEYDDYHQGISILLSIPNFKPVSQIPFDYMHLVCIGVFKKVMSMWVSGKPECQIVRLKHCKIVALNNSLKNMRSYITNDFARRPQDIVNLGKWKATELRQMLLYTCPVALFGVVHPRVYEHVLTLHVSMRILCSQKLLDLHSDYAKLLLEHFVETFIILYGKHYVSHNVHGLLHLVEDAKLLGPLDNFSAFEFENCLRLIKRQLRKSAHPLQQLYRRYSEESLNILNVSVKSTMFNKKHVNGIVLSTTDTDQQYKKAKINNSIITITNPDNYCMIKESNIVVTICNIVYDKTMKYMV